MSENRMTSAPSPDGRRILIAVVTGEVGQRIQAWRCQHDPEQAERLPPHATLCYWAPEVEPERLERQVRHAFPRPVEVRLRGVHKGTNDQETLFAQMLETDALDAAHVRLYDGTHVTLPARDGWLWHVTCVRESRGRDQAALLAAAEALQLDDIWTVDTVSYMRLNGERYESLATWHL